MFLFNKSFLKTFIVLIFQAAVLAACVSSPPYEDYTLAREALRSAEEADSGKFSPQFWLKAEAAYRRGEQAYKMNQFDQAQKYFIEAKLWSEKAENQSRLKKFESGDMFQ